jgi:hypothetical protein
MNEEAIKFKKDEISKITNELKSHYLVDEFFVDPDKKFMKLLEKIIVRKHKFSIFIFLKKPNE